jgi:nucleoside-diphosphate-sugar epimerase
MEIRIPPIHEKPRSGDIRDSVSDISAAKTSLGYRASYSLDKGLRETIAYFRDREQS